MDTNLMIVWIGIIVIVVGTTLPVTYIFFRWLHGLINAMKVVKAEVVDEYQNFSMRYVEEQLTECIQKQQEKQEKGTFRYYTDKLKHVLNKYGIWLYMVIGVLAVGLAILSPVLSGLQNDSMNTLENPKHAALIFLPVELILFFVYWCSKTDKRKWQSGAMLILVLFLSMVWDLAVEKSAKGYMNLFLIMLMVVTVGHHYSRWKQECERKFLELEKILHESSYASHALLEQYNKLREFRHDTRKHFTVLQYLTQEKEMEMMQTYIRQLECHNKGVQENEVQ